ncbi:hypothetical protein ASF30_18820 [Leifsonia sp. Leaf264]|nr:hypothetical protein ASF30_18820 [Leifsonia sp. Leaf264]
MGVPGAAFWKSLAAHLAIPLFLAAGMALSYLGAFHEPAPHDLHVAVVGDSPASMVFAQTLDDRADGKLHVETTPTHASAEKLVRDGDVAAAYETTATEATLVVASAASDTTAAAAQKIFLPIAYSQHLPFTVDDVVPVGEHDSTGQGLFFLMVALSVGAYASAIAIAAVTARIGIGWRMGIAALVSGVVAAIGVVVAEPVFQMIPNGVWGIWLVSWLYVFGIIAIGVGLHPVLGKWTTPALTLLFVMLNVTSCGGIFAAPFQPALFAGLHTFWNGAAFIDAVQSLAYFPGRQFGFDGLRLALWATAGLMLIVVVHGWSVRRTRIADETLAVTRDEEEQVVAA